MNVVFFKNLNQLQTICFKTSLLYQQAKISISLSETLFTERRIVKAILRSVFSKCHFSKALQGQLFLVNFSLVHIPALGAITANKEKRLLYWQYSFGTCLLTLLLEQLLLIHKLMLDDPVILSPFST